MADNAEELAIIRLLIEQNGETVNLLRSMMEKLDERRKVDQQRFEEILDLAKSTGVIQMFVEKLRKPRLVPSNPEEKCPKCNGNFGKPKFVRKTRQKKDGVETTLQEEHLLHTCDDCEFSKKGPTVERADGSDPGAQTG